MPNPKKYKIDVLITSVFFEENLHECIESVLTQNRRQIEILIHLFVSKVPPEINLAEAYNLPKNVEIHTSEKLVSSSTARNTLLNSSNNEFIAFLDGDDTWETNKLRRQFDLIEKYDLDLCCTDIAIFDLDRNITYHNTSAGDSEPIEKILPTNPIPFSSSVIRRSILGKTQFQKIQIRNDHSFWFSLFQKDLKARKLNDQLVTYRVRSGAASSNKLKAARFQYKMYREVCRFGHIKSLLYFTQYIYINWRRYASEKRVKSTIQNSLPFKVSLSFIYNSSRLFLRKLTYLLSKKPDLGEIDKFTKDSQILFDFNSLDIHFGDVLFWLPVIIFLKEQGYQLTVLLGKKQNLFSDHFNEWLAGDKNKLAHHNLRNAIRISHQNSLHAYTCNYVFSPTKIKLENSIAFSIFNEIVSKTDEKDGDISSYYDDILTRIPEMGIFNYHQNIILNNLVRNNTVVSIDTQTRSILARRKKLKILQQIAEKPDELFFLIGVEEHADLPANVIDLTRYSKFPEILYLAKLEEVKFLGIDNFWAHFFEIHGVPSQIIFRGALTEESRVMHEKYFLNAFRGNSIKPRF